MPKPKPQSKKPSRSRWTEREARAVLEAQRASGLSIQKFAQHEGLVAERLYRWHRRIGRGTPSKSAVAPVFVELSPPVREQLEVVLVGGRVLRFPALIDVSILPRIADALETAKGC
jgi:transposase-like protein